MGQKHSASNFYVPNEWNEAHSDEAEKANQLDKVSCICCMSGIAFNGPCLVGEVAASLPVDNGCVSQRASGPKFFLLTFMIRRMHIQRMLRGKLRRRLLPLYLHGRWRVHCRGHFIHFGRPHWHVWPLSARSSCRCALREPSLPSIHRSCVIFSLPR